MRRLLDADHEALGSDQMARDDPHAGIEIEDHAARGAEFLGTVSAV